MADRLSDAELVERLRLFKSHGSGAAAAALGVTEGQFRASIRQAKARNLTHASTIPDELAQLRARLKIAEREAQSLKVEADKAETLRQVIYGLAAVRPDMPDWVSSPTGTHSSAHDISVPVALWSDWHWGEVVEKAEVGGMNAFSRKIAKARLQVLVHAINDLCKHNMGSLKYPGIVICLGGDMISGNIHEELRESNEGPVQKSILEVQDELFGAISYMADCFGHVFLPCVVGNHGRTTVKPRAKGRAFESYEWSIYQNLERAFAKDPRVRFMVSDNADAHFTVYGHRFMLTHGDALGVKGGDGLIGALGPITRGAIKVGRNQAQIGRDFDTLLMGHWHMYTPRGEGSSVVVNGTLKGYDEYAHTILRVPYGRPSQALFFVHPAHGITAQWQVYLEARGAKSKTWLSFLENAR